MKWLAAIACFASAVAAAQHRIDVSTDRRDLHMGVWSDGHMLAGCALPCSIELPDGVYSLSLARAPRERRHERDLATVALLEDQAYDVRWNGHDGERIAGSFLALLGGMAGLVGSFAGYLLMIASGSGDTGDESLLTAGFATSGIALPVLMASLSIGLYFVGLRDFGRFELTSTPPR